MLCVNNLLVFELPTEIIEVLRSYRLRKPETGKILRRFS
jgi:hypothetical protein